MYRFLPQDRVAFTCLELFHFSAFAVDMALVLAHIEEDR